MDNEKDFDLNCPLPLTSAKNILLSHGGGGSLSYQLIHDVFLKTFGNKYLNEEHDGAVVRIGNSKLAFTTDSYVVQPLFFPGGSIAELAVYGTVNDLAMCGAKPLFISCAFIIEEGLEIALLQQITGIMNKAAETAGVQIITGDTKVVQKGKGDKLFINTSGIGLVPEDVNISPANIKPGNKIILNGTIADHGAAVLAARENINMEQNIKSDTAPLNSLTDRILSVSRKINVMRDPTRGGLASALNEIALKSNKDILIYENKIKIKEEVRSFCEILGFDPLYIANEGKMICFVDEADAHTVLNEMRNHPLGKDAEIIGEVLDADQNFMPINEGRVILQTILGTKRIVDMLSGEQLPRIC